MMNVTISKENPLTKVKADIKRDVMAKLVDLLRSEYGNEEVKIVRTGNASKVNEIAIYLGDGTGEDGETNPIVVTVNPMVKDFVNRKTAKKTIVPFDFYGAVESYDNYIEQKQREAEEKEKKNNEVEF